MNGDAPNSIWIWSEGQATGPFDASDIETRFTAGELPWNVLASRSGTDWAPLSEIMQPRSIASPAQPPVLKRRASNTFPWYVWAGLMVGFAALGFGMKTGLEQLTRTVEWRPTREKAYQEAVSYIQDQLVGARTFSPIDKSWIRENGGEWTVQVRVDGLNAFGGPVRNDITVKLGATAMGFVVRGIER